MERNLYRVGAPAEQADPPIPTLIDGDLPYFEGDTVMLDPIAAQLHGQRVTLIEPPSAPEPAKTIEPPTNEAKTKK